MKPTKISIPQVWIAVILFLLLLLLQVLLEFISYINEQYIEIIITAILIVYSIYLIFIGWYYFSGTYSQWVSHNDWITGLLKAYGSLFLFGNLLLFLLLNWRTDYLVTMFIPSGRMIHALQSVTLRILKGGLTLAFPVSLYSLFLAIKSMFVIQQKHQTYFYGIFLFVFSGILLWKSYPSFILVLRMLFTGG